MNEAYLCLGGNLGNCTETFAKCVLLLEKTGMERAKTSSVYTSKAWGMEDAPDFYNQVISVKTRHAAQELMEILLGIEKQLGRERKATVGYESRTLDIDILFFNTGVYDTPSLHIPHPRLNLRRFVLQPLNEIAPGLVHPVFKKTVAELLHECPDKGIVKEITHVA